MCIEESNDGGEGVGQETDSHDPWVVQVVIASPKRMSALFERMCVCLCPLHACPEFVNVRMTASIEKHGAKKVRAHRPSSPRVKLSCESSDSHHGGVCWEAGTFAATGTTVSLFALEHGARGASGSLSASKWPR